MPSTYSLLMRRCVSYIQNQVFTLLKELIKKNLSAANRLVIRDDSLQRAAVVVAIIESPNLDNSPCFLLTRRASKLRAHAGQFALPGGKIDPGESVENAALRELEEELGIALNQNSILGLLDDYATKSGYCITPIVVWVGQPGTITPNPDEVAEVFNIPIEELSDEGLINFNHAEHAEQSAFSINLASIGHEIYAPTAAIICQFYEAAITQNTTRRARFQEPTFAWK